MTSSVNVREIVLETLLLITRDGEYSHIALRNVLDKYQYLEKKERAFITRVVDGTLERMIEIDYIINQFSKVKVNKMKPVIRTIIRSSVYQLKYMDSIPDRAVCNEAVNLAVKKGFAPLKGFVNGVLRNIGRNMDNVEYPSKENIASYLSISYSLPEWIVEKWIQMYGKDTVEKMGKAFLRENPLSIRCNLNQITKEDLIQKLRMEGVMVEEIPDTSCGLYIAGYDYLGSLQSFCDGDFYVQDVSSMRVAQWAEPSEGDQILDVCAAPGGKALHVAEMLHGTGLVQARDLTEYKVRMIEENIERSRLQNIETMCWDARIFDQEWEERADVVIADLPCSGLGVFGKKPDLKYKVAEDALEELAALQREILSTVQRYVKAGGKLVYSTCTINCGENEENARWFEESHPEFKMIREQQLLPGIDDGDGFYIAVFQKENHG